MSHSRHSYIDRVAKFHRPIPHPTIVKRCHCYVPKLPPHIFMLVHLSSHTDWELDLLNPSIFGPSHSEPVSPPTLASPGRKRLVSPPPGLPLADFPPLSAVEAKLPAHDQTTRIPQLPKDAKGAKVTALDEISQSLSAAPPIQAPHASKPSPRSRRTSTATNEAVQEPKEVRESTKIDSGKSERSKKLSKLDTATDKDQKGSEAGNLSQPTTTKKGGASKRDVPAGKSPTQPATPATAASQSPASSVVRQPRTLRLVQTPKSEAPHSAETPLEAAIAQDSRRTPHERTQSATNIPRTPVNELISEHASVTSNTVSRSVSPSLDTKLNITSQSRSKAQKKKDRQAKAKQVDDIKVVQESQRTSVEEPPLEGLVQAPMMGRKKKTKKPKQQTDAKTVTETTIEKPEVAEPEAARASAPMEVETPPEIEVAVEGTETPAVEETTDESKQGPSFMNLSTPAAVVSRLRDQGGLDSGIFDTFLKPDSLHQKAEGAAPPDALDGWEFKLSLSQRRALDRNDAVVVRLSDHEHGVILPDGSICRYLTEEEAAKYIRLRKDILQNDPSFLSNANLPFCGRMDSTWREATNILSTGGFEMASAGIGFEDDYGTSPDTAGIAIVTDSTGLSGGRGRMDVVGLATRIEAMTREEAEKALRTSEDMMVAARKAAEMEEKRFNALLKRNRKIIKDPA